MKICLVCGYREKDDSSPFCANCGKSFENKKVFVPKPNNIKLAFHNNTKWILIRILILTGIILNAFIIIATNFSISYLWLIQIVLFIFAYIAVVKLETIKARHSKY